jgi:hypothetical protein
MSQNLDLAEIEAIVSEIEREKEAGWCMTRPLRLITESISLLQRLKENALGWPQPQQGRLLWLNGQENNRWWIVINFVTTRDELECFILLPGGKHLRTFKFVLLRDCLCT